TSKTETSKTETSKTETSKPDESKAVSNDSEISVPIASEPTVSITSKPDESKPDESKPDESKPENSKTESTGSETSITIASDPTVSTVSKPDESKINTVSAQESKEESAEESEHIYTEPSSSVSIKRVSQKKSNIVNIMLIGRDSLDTQNVLGFSDAMVIVSYNTSTKAVKLLSFDRDILVPIENHSWAKLNNSYYWGGAGLLINTVNSVFGLDIQYYITIDLQGVVDIVDRMGGLDIYLTQKEVDTYRTYAWGYVYPDLKAGYNHLDGDHVRQHVQNRSDSTAERSRRQRQVIEAIMKKIMSEYTLSDMLSLLDYCTTKVKTNLSLTKLISYAYDVASGKVSFTDSQSVPFSGKWEYVRYNGIAAKKIDFTVTSELIAKYLYG
ncbi:MAG TPA: LCP family protein, partial [Bacillota bacterium]|nr:LCP family protein [Bacillota bacterium]